MLVDQGEIQQLSRNTTYNSQQTEISSLKGFFCRQMFRLSSTFSQELDDAVPHSDWHQRSDYFDAFSNPNQQPPAAEHQLITVSRKNTTSNRLYPERSSIIFAKSLAKNSLSLCTLQVFFFDRPALHSSAHHTRRLHVSDAFLNHRRKQTRECHHFLHIATVEQFGPQ